jgi:hypothetical protein
MNAPSPTWPRATFRLPRRKPPRHGRRRTTPAPDSSYQLAFTDTPFLLREELRPVRMQLELLKPELVLSEEGIVATVVIFGSARWCRARWPKSDWRVPNPR